ncbi:hypothetical protein O0L34_g9071 [Tuta absoluta]|nr:hypothetical protein O0L34_g9071 [Tuta absoluta]
MKREHIEHLNPLAKCLNKITRYHYWVFFLLFFTKAFIAWHFLNLIFLSPPTDFTCNGAKNECPCDDAVWDKSVFTETIQTKFSIYCSNAWLMQFSNSVSYFGCLAGALFFGFLSDKIGRLNALCLAFMTVSIFGCLVALMPNIYLFIVMRFFEGAGAGGGIICGFVLCIEFCSAEHREVITALYHIPFNIGHLTIAGISYLLRHMDHFQLAISIPCLFAPLIKFIMMESPKWLMDNDYIDTLVQGLKRICP